MVVHTLPVGQLETNCYIIHKESCRSCLVIDPGGDWADILAFLDAQALTPEAILLTHGHFDHVGAVRQIAGKTGCPVYLHQKEFSLPPFMTDGPLYATHDYGEGDTLSLADLVISVMETPGHTPGSVCLQVENVLFTGDTLFAGSCGRVDFPGSNPAQMRASLARLAALEEDYVLYSGHGSATTLNAEKRDNPYLKGML